MKFTETKSEDRKSGKKNPSCPKKDTHGMRKDNRERLLAEDE